MSHLIFTYMTLNHDFSMVAYVGWKLLPKDTKGRFNIRDQETTWNAICKEAELLTSGCNIMFKYGKKIILLIALLGLASESECLCLFVLAFLGFSLFLIFWLMCSSSWVSEFTYFYNSSLGQFHLYFLLCFWWMFFPIVNILGVSAYLLLYFLPPVPCSTSPVPPVSRSTSPVPPVCWSTSPGPPVPRSTSPGPCCFP